VHPRAQYCDGFQSYALYPHMSVRRNRLCAGAEEGCQGRIDAASKPRRNPYREPARSAAKRCRAVNGAGRLGRAIVREPSVFLFDEPLSNLDAKLRPRCGRLIRLHRDWEPRSCMSPTTRWKQ
jgi:ABC-type sugar transport system ATPase subunit